MAAWSSSASPSTRGPSIPKTSACWKISSAPPCTTPRQRSTNSTSRPWAASAWVAASAACSAVDAPTAPLPRRSGLYAGPVQDLIDELGRLPGVGPKSAQRIAFHLLKLPKEDAVRLARVIVEAKEKVAWCERCFNLSEGPLCGICADDRRDAHTICVVEEPKDLV